jgi:hypothetical protein
VLIPSARFVGRVLQRWKWSTKQARYKQILKYTWANIRYYLVYVSAIIMFDIMRLKFIDEAMFESRSLKRKSGLAQRGRDLIGLQHGRGNCCDAPNLICTRRHV